MFILSLVLVLSVCALLANAQEGHQIGFGRSRLSKLRGKHSLGVQGGAGATSTCPDVEQYWFKDAYVDNFAPADKMQPWQGQGQRFWLNKKFFAGANAPIFVFIGGEGEESCARLGPRM